MFLMRMLPVIAIALGGAFGFAADATVDAKTGAILNALGAHLSAAKTAEVNLRLAVKNTNGPAPRGDLTADYLLSVERPNKMALVLNKGDLGATVVSDGTNTFTFVPKPAMYTVQKASKQIGGVENAAAPGD